MKVLHSIVLLLVSSLTLASPQFSACAFDLELASAPILKNDVVILSGRTVEKIDFKHDTFQESSRLCPELNMGIEVTLDASQENLEALKNLSEASTVRVVHEEMEGLYFDGEIIGWRRHNLWQNGEYIANR